MTLILAIFYALTISLASCNYCTIEVVANPEEGDDSCYGAFSKYADVFGIRTYGTSTVSDCWVQQQAYIVYGLIDNDYDDEVDNPTFLNAQFSHEGPFGRRRGTMIGIFDTGEEK